MKAPFIIIESANGKTDVAPKQPKLSGTGDSFNVKKFQKWTAIFQENDGPLYCVCNPIAGKKGQPLKSIRKLIEVHT